MLLSSAQAASAAFAPYGFQSGSFRPGSSSPSSRPPLSQSDYESMNDDSYAGSMYYDPQHGLLYFAGSTYGTFFDSATDLDGEIKSAMGMNGAEGGRDASHSHLENSDCFLGILKLPRADDGSSGGGGGGGPTALDEGADDAAPWLTHGAGPEMVFARRFGTPHSTEACSSVLMLPSVNDALLQTEAQLKIAMLGHVNPTPLSAADVDAMGPVGGEDGDEYSATGTGDGGQRGLRRLRFSELDRNWTEQNDTKSTNQWRRRLDYDGNRGGFFHSISHASPVTSPGRAYGFVVDFDVSLTLDETFTTAPDATSFSNAYGALLGGFVLESSPLVYPVAMAQSRRDPNQVYIVSMHSDDEEMTTNPEYGAAVSATQREADGTVRDRADATVGGAGGNKPGMVGGVPHYGTNFYVKIQQLTVTPYEQLMHVEPTPDEKVKRTMTSGWGFGFKLNDANDVRPSSVVFVKGRTPNEDLLLLGGTTRKAVLDDGSRVELDGFITKLIPPAPTPIADETTGHTVEEAMQDESVHPTKRIDSTTGRDETVTAICLPPPDTREGIISHAYVVGSTSSDRGTQSIGRDPSIAYILKMRLDDLSTVWKEHLPSIHPAGTGGDVLGEGCAVSPDGSMVYLGGTIDGGSALSTGVEILKPIGGSSDVFVAAYDVEFGNVQWAKQLGTVYEDKLARGGGVTCDEAGNALIMGSTRGGLQRPRPEGVAGDVSRAASDIFVMNLSYLDGEHIGAPFPDNGDGRGAPSRSAPSRSAPTVAEPMDKSSGGHHMSAIAAAGISLMVVGFVAALLFAALRLRGGRPRRQRPRRNSDGVDGDVMRMWDDEGIDFTYGGHSLGGRQSRAMAERAGGSVRGQRSYPISGERAEEDDEWDDAAKSLSRNATWMKSVGGDDDSVHSSASNASSSSKRSYTSKQTDDNVDFLSSLRREADATMKKMVKGSDQSADDPRLDGGASIKSLLTHYREVKKGGLIEGGGGGGGSMSGGSVGSGGSRGSPKQGRSGKQKKSRPPPPPPPPRRMEDDRETNISSRDGLSEFTIV